MEAAAAADFDLAAAAAVVVAVVAADFDPVAVVADVAAVPPSPPRWQHPTFPECPSSGVAYPPAATQSSAASWRTVEG